MIKEKYHAYNMEYIMKILFILSITVLIVFAAGCDEMQNQMTKPITMSDDEVPTEDPVVASMGTMKEPPAETDDTREEPSTETDDKEEDTNAEEDTDESQDDTSEEPQTMEEDTTVETNVPMEDPLICLKRLRQHLLACHPQAEVYRKMIASPSNLTTTLAP